MTKIKITCEFDFDFDERATEDFKWRTIQGVLDNVHGRQLSYQFGMMYASKDRYEVFAKDIKLDTKIAKQISENSKVVIIKE